MKTETFDDPQAFLAAVTGKKTRRGKNDIPRAPKGIGDKLSALMRLSSAGWVTYQCQAGWHYFRHTDGRESPARQTYEDAIIAAEGKKTRP